MKWTITLFILFGRYESILTVILVFNPLYKKKLILVFIRVLISHPGKNIEYFNEF